MKGLKVRASELYSRPWEWGLAARAAGTGMQLLGSTLSPGSGVQWLEHGGPGDSGLLDAVPNSVTDSV